MNTPESAQTTPAMPSDANLDAYAQLLIRNGINVQPGQCLQISCELEHAPFVRRLAHAAYKAGARYVEVVWRDDLLERARALDGGADDLEFVPEHIVTRARQATDDSWGLIFLTGAADPDALADVEPALIARMRTARRRKTRFLSEAQMADLVPWCVAAVPTRAWARKVFPTLEGADALASLWATVLMTVRADLPDPVAAWKDHAGRLDSIARALNRSGVRSLHIVDPTPGADGLPRTDLSVGLTDAPVWAGGTSTTPADVVFLPNVPTEEVFTTPHSRHVEGYVSTSKPGFPLDRRVDGAFFRFKGGEVVEYRATEGQEALDAFFSIPGSQRLGEIALVDERSPINQTGLVFHDVLFDENCVSHFAFGKAYPTGTLHGASMTDDERDAAGINESDTHSDFMIGTPTMNVTGIRPDGSEVAIVRNGQIVIDLDVEPAQVEAER